MKQGKGNVGGFEQRRGGKRVRRDKENQKIKKKKKERRRRGVWERVQASQKSQCLGKENEEPTKETWVWLVFIGRWENLLL